MRAKVPMLINRSMAKELFGDSPNTFYAKLKGIEEQTKKGRYNRYSVSTDGTTKLVNPYVYYDYTIYRARLESRNASKYVPEFQPRMIRDLIPDLEREVQAV